MSDSDPKDELAGSEAPFVSHLIELRDRLIRAFIAVAVAFLVLAVWPGPAALYDLLAAPLVAPGGYLVLCSCSHAAALAAFRNACARGIGRGGRRAQILHTGFAGADHPVLPQLAESGYLKALAFRLDG